MVTSRRDKRTPEDSVKDRILDAATALFAARGPEATAVDDIVRQARCNKRMVYHYFGSKEALYRAVLLEIYRAIEKFEERTVRENGDRSPRDFIERVVAAYLKFHAAHPHFVSLLTWENLNRGRSIRHLPIRATKNAILEGFERNVPLPRRELQQFFISLSALCYFTYSNRHTMKHILGFDPASPARLEERRRHIVSLLCDNYLKARSRSG
jgi:AcrR family transcriptional regulator